MGIKNSAQPVAVPSFHLYSFAHVQHNYNQIHSILLLMYGEMLLKLYFDTICTYTYVYSREEMAQRETEVKYLMSHSELLSIVPLFRDCVCVCVCGVCNIVEMKFSANASSLIQRPRRKSLVTVHWIHRYALAFIFRLSCFELKAYYCMNACTAARYTC
jgi:hypothetical protein